MERFSNYKNYKMFKKILSLLLGGYKKRPVYALVPKQNTRLPQKKSS